MPKIAKKLGALEVQRLSEVKLHQVGTVPGLGLSISKSGAKSWILRTTIGARRSDIGLGSYPAITLAKAWELARETLAVIRAGADPVAERRAKQSKVEWTFKRSALAYIDGHEASWKNAKHSQQWRNSLQTYVYPIFGDKHVRDVGMADVINASYITAWALQGAARPAFSSMMRASSAWSRLPQLTPMRTGLP